MNTLSNAFVVLLLLAAAGCASSAREPVTTYDRSDVGTVQRTESGTIISLTPVDIEGSRSRVGTVVGAVAGGLAGSQIGGGSGQDIMTVIGAVAGGYAGSKYGEGTARSDGVEIGIKMDDGREVSVVQELEENETFRVGEQVRLVYTGDKARVEH